MGSFYVNITLRGPVQHSVVPLLKNRSAYVSPTEKNCTVVFDEQCDSQDQQVISHLSSELSKHLDCPVFAILNHDDDILWYQLFAGGTLIDEYDSTPGYFDETAEPSGPSGGNANALCHAFQSENVDEVERILQTSSFAEEGYVFAVERHEELVTVLGLPTCTIGYGFRDISSGAIPEGFEQDQFILTK